MIFTINQILTGIVGLLRHPLAVLHCSWSVYWSRKVSLDLPKLLEINGKKVDWFTFSKFEIPNQVSNWDIPLHDLFWLVQIMRSERPQKIMELGTFTGLTTLYLAKYSDDDSVITTIDLPDHLFKKRRPRKSI